MVNYNVFLGDSKEMLRQLDDNSIDCCITSPPYYGLRDYGTGKWIGGDPNCPHKRLSKFSESTITGHRQEGLRGNVGDAIFKSVCPLCGAIRKDGQIGLEETPQDYVASLMEVFNEVHRILKPTGTFWLNIGDTYNSDKNMYGIPWRVAFALQDAGWILRQDIIWHKPQTMPEPVKDRCVKSHEYIFLLSKEPSYYFDYKAIQEPSYYFDYKAIQEPSYYFDSDSRAGKRNPRPEGKRKNAKGMDNTPVIINEMRNKRDVWSVNTDHFEGAHFATFPPKLIEPMVLAGCPRGGVILDPFTGSGTTGVVAMLNDRNFIGCELNPQYQKMAMDRIRDAWQASPTLF